MFKKNKNIVYIYGPVSSGKTPWAEKIAERVESCGFLVDISDMEIFSFTPNFKKKLQKIEDRFLNSKNDVCIITIGTGNTGAFKIEIKGFFCSPMSMFDILFNDGSFSLLNKST